MANCDTTPLTKAKHLYYIAHQARHPTSALIRKGPRSPMSRTSLHRPRRPRVVWDRPATGTRLFPCPFPPNAPLHFPHYKRCPKAHRLRLRSDQSLSRPVHVTGYGRSPDIVRLALSKGNCRIGAPLTGRSGSALGASKEPKYPGLRLRAITPLQDYTVVPLGDPLSPGDGSQLPLPPPLRVAERNSPSPDSTVVALGEAMPHSDGRESTPPYLRMAGHFWWSRLPHTEIILASPPRPLRSTGLSQSRRRCGTSAVADNTHRYRRRRLPAQPSGTFHPLPLPFSPSFLRRQVADAPRRESIPGRAGAPLLGAYPPLPLPPPCPLPQ